MTSTLLKDPVASLLADMFAKADDATSPVFTDVPQGERIRLMQSKTDYLELYGQLKELWLAVSKETALLLYQLARSTKAKTIVEYGTSFGISTLHLASALRDNGGGKLITCEFEPSKIAVAKQHFAQAQLDDLIEIRQGDALHTLASNVPANIDLLLLDGAKALYGDILELLRPNLRAGALIVADNADYCPEYLELIRKQGSGFLSVPFAEDVELTLYLGA